MNVDLSREVVVSSPDGQIAHETYMVPVGAGPFATVTFLVAAVRDRWRLWAATATCGVLAAIGLSLLSPPPYTATTTLLLRHPSLADPTRAMQTDVELVKTRTVAQAAVGRLALRLSPKDLSSDVRVTPLTSDVLQLTVKGPTAGDAIRRADAMADAFLAFRRDEFERQSRAVVDALETRRRELTDELTVVNDEVTAFRGSDQGDDSAVRALGDLLVRRSSLSDQIAQLRQRIDQSLIDPASVVQKSRVLDRASADDRSPLTVLAANVAAGTVAGLAIGAGWVVVAAVLSDRVHQREDVVAGLSAPVAVSVGPLRGSLRVQRRRFRRQLLRPQPDVSRVLRHLGRLLSSTDHVPPSLVVASIASDPPAALLVASMGMECVNSGRNALIADFSGDRVLATLFAVPAEKTSALHPGQSGSTLWLTFPLLDFIGGVTDGATELELQDLRRRADVVLVFAPLDQAVGAEHLAEWATTAVAVVTARRSRVTALRSASHMIRAAGLELSSVILVGADRRDQRASPLAESSGPAVEEPPVRRRS